MSSAAKPGLAGIAALDDPCPDVTKVAIKLTSLAVTLLHIDPVLSPTSGVKGSPQDDSVHPLTCLADKFFSNLGTYGFGGKDFDDMTEKFVAACSKDHLRYNDYIEPKSLPTSCVLICNMNHYKEVQSCSWVCQTV